MSGTSERPPVRTRESTERAVDEGAVAEWKAERYAAFHATMTDEAEPFPCTFAVEGHLAGDLRYQFPDAPDAGDGYPGFAAGLASFLADESVPAITSLVVMFGSTPERSQSWYADRFWGALDYLRANDPEPWPEDRPRDPSHPEWTFCYAGEPLFMVARTPEYDRRRSRYTPHGLEVTVQPRSVFDGLEADTERGAAARRVIRERLADYDDADRHPDIGDFGDGDAREWQQYLLPEDGGDSVEDLPLSVAGD
jgi:hypothetical protein